MGDDVFKHYPKMHPNFQSHLSDVNTVEWFWNLAQSKAMSMFSEPQPPPFFHWPVDEFWVDFLHPVPHIEFTVRAGSSVIYSREKVLTSYLLFVHTKVQVSEKNTVLLNSCAVGLLVLILIICRPQISMKYLYQQKNVLIQTTNLIAVYAIKIRGSRLQTVIATL